MQEKKRKTQAVRNQSNIDLDSTVVVRDFQGKDIIGKKQEENYTEHIFLNSEFHLIS